MGNHRKTLFSQSEMMGNPWKSLNYNIMKAIFNGKFSSLGKSWNQMGVNWGEVLQLAMFDSQHSNMVSYAALDILSVLFVGNPEEVVVGHSIPLEQLGTLACADLQRNINPV